MELINLKNLQLYDEEIKEYLKQKILESSTKTTIHEDSFLKFPTLGNEHSLYVDTTSNKLYRWSDTDLKYYTIGSDYNDIKIINGNH